jgi:O-antigen ligase
MIKNRSKKILQPVILILLILYAGYIVGILDIFANRLGGLIGEISMKSGTFGSRYESFFYKWKEITKISPIIGAGYKWDTSIKMSPGTPEALAKIYVNNPYAPNSDDGYGMIILVLGLSGLLLFILFYISLFFICLRLLEKKLPELEKAIIYGGLGLCPYVLVTNIGLDNFYWPYSVIPNIIYVAIIIYIYNEYYQKINKKTPQSIKLEGSLSEIRA